MTNEDFYNLFLLRTDKVHTHASPSITPEEASDLATLAMYSYIKERYSWKSNTRKYGAEETQKRYEELGELVNRVILNPLAPSLLNIKNGRFYQLPNTTNNMHWLTLMEWGITNIQCPDLSFKEVELKEISHNEYPFLIRDPFHKPSRRLAWKLGRHINYQVEIVTDGTYLIKDLHLTYIRKPNRVDLLGPLNNPFCQLADITHDEILQKTIDLYKLTIEDPSYQIELQKSINLND